MELALYEFAFSPAEKTTSTIRMVLKSVRLHARSQARGMRAPGSMGRDSTSRSCLGERLPVPDR